MLQFQTNKMGEPVFAYFLVVFLYFSSPVLSQTSPDVVCYPTEKVINVAEGSAIALVCSIEVSNDEEPTFAWSTSDDKYIDDMETTETVEQHGQFKNVTSTSTIHSKKESPTFLTEASFLG